MNCKQTDVLLCLQSMGEKKLMKENLEKVDKLKEVADRLGVSLAQMCLAWCARNPNVSTVITGSTKLEQVCTVMVVACV
jgi:aryl-alcohol dehydrogenase-like predicted oxidoreductase